MSKSSEESFTYDALNIKLPSLQMWLQTLQGNSENYRKYGSFLPAQKKLLRQIHYTLSKSKSKVANFTAPPASGKTHVIALSASYLNDLDIPTCIVTPNNELRSEFRDELKDVNSSSRNSLQVLNIGSFVRKRHQFDFVFVDEAHNLRSAIELDRDIVKSFHFEKDDPFYDDIASTLDKRGGHSTKELSIEATHDILTAIGQTQHSNDAYRILRTLSQWRSFFIASDTTCDLKFLAADPQKRSLLPKGKLLLFSATLLNWKELVFYCSIPESLIQMPQPKQEDFVPKENVKYCCFVCASYPEKTQFVLSILRNAEKSSLILLNNNSMCSEWSRELTESLHARVITIKSGLDYGERTKLYKRFCERSDGVLLTSSNVYWEGLSIRNLGLLIIPNSPYPQPTLLEIADGVHTQFQRIAKRRLIQGVGRIGRSSHVNGICILLFQPSGMRSHFKSVTSEEANELVYDLAASEI